MRIRVVPEPRMLAEGSSLTKRKSMDGTTGLEKKKKRRRLSTDSRNERSTSLPSSIHSDSSDSEGNSDYSNCSARLTLKRRQARNIRNSLENVTATMAVIVETKIHTETARKGLKIPSPRRKSLRATQSNFLSPAYTPPSLPITGTLSTTSDSGSDSDEQEEELDGQKSTRSDDEDEQERERTQLETPPVTRESPPPSSTAQIFARASPKPPTTARRPPPGSSPPPTPDEQARPGGSTLLTRINKKIEETVSKSVENIAGKQILKSVENEIQKEVSKRINTYFAEEVSPLILLHGNKVKECMSQVSLLKKKNELLRKRVSVLENELQGL